MLELLIFTILTIAFFIGRYFFTTPSFVRIMWGTYILLVLTNAMVFNYTLLSKNCEGNVNFGTVFLNTALPWLLIFGSIQAALVTFPAWKMPFSNTFGYLATKVGGIDNILFKLLKSPTPSSGTIQKTLNNIYSNPALFINEITPGNFSDFAKRSSFLFVQGATSKPEWMQFYNLIRVKDLIAGFLWSLLSGMLVSTVSYNNLVNTNCTNSVAEMKKRHDDYERKVKADLEEEKNAPPKRVYYIRD